MRSLLLRLLVLATALFFVAGCSDDSTAPADTQSATQLIEGEIGDADFEIRIGATGNARQHFEGPFVLRGTNLHYEDSLQALVVDLTIANRGDVAHAEPVALTFVNLIPDGVTVLNPDNGINGDGAAITFAFANDDGRWTPDEVSLPRTVQFGVAPNTSIGFTARLDIGEPIDGGSIAGLVWNDANEDGVIDPDEDGVRGAMIALRSIGDPDTMSTDERRTTRTDRNGLYAFHRLPAGIYTVSKVPSDRMEPTTPTEITVLLVETDGDVSDFTEANFGCVVEDDTPDPFPVGAFIEVNGHYATDPDRLIAQGVEVSRCGDDDDDDEDDVRGGVLSDGGDDEDDDDDGEDCERGKLRGPVTEIDAANFAFAVMGTMVQADQSTFPAELEVGDRVDVRLHHGDGDELIVDVVKEWHNDRHEQVHGRIDSVVMEDNALHVTVLGTLIVIQRRPHEGS